MYRSSSRTTTNSTVKALDSSEVVNEVLTVYYDSFLNVNYCTLSKEPKGEVIALIIHKSNEDTVVDGSMNRRGRIIEFLPNDSYHGCLCDVKYMVGP